MKKIKKIFKKNKQSLFLQIFAERLKNSVIDNMLKTNRETIKSISNFNMRNKRITSAIDVKILFFKFVFIIYFQNFFLFFYTL